MILDVPAGDRSQAIARVVQAINRLFPHRTLLVTIEVRKAERSDAQNRALWGCAYKVASDETGHSKDELHELFCGEYFGWVEYEVLGKRKKRPRRTTTHDHEGKRDVISKLDLSDFYLFIQQRCSEYGIQIPDPDQEWKDAVEE